MVPLGAITQRFLQLDRSADVEDLHAGGDVVVQGEGGGGRTGVEGTVTEGEVPAQAPRAGQGQLQSDMRSAALQSRHSPGSFERDKFHGDTDGAPSRRIE